MLVASADAGRGVAVEQSGGDDKAEFSSAFRSCAEADDVLDQRLEFPQVLPGRQTRQKLFSQHFTGDCRAAVGMRRTAVGVVPWTIAAVGQLRFCHIPRAQFHQSVHPLIQMPAADVRPDVADLLLTGSPDFFDIVEMFFNCPARGNGLQNVANCDLCISAEIGSPAAIVESHDHDADDAAHQTRRCKERFTLPRHHRATTLIRHRFPAIGFCRKL